MAGLALAAPLAARQVTEVQVVPDAMALTVGERRPVLATLFDRTGQVVTGVTPLFSSADPAVATVSAQGMVTAVGPGLAVVDVRVGDRGAVVAVSVRGNPMPPGIEEAARLVANHPRVELLPGEEVGLAAAALRADGSAIGGVSASWQSADSAVATVSASRVRGRSPGSTTVTGSAAGLQVEVPVTVTAANFAFGRTTPTLAPGERDTLRVVLPSQGGRAVASGLRWSSSDTAIVSITPDGVALGVRPGQADAIVQGYGQEGRLPLRVHEPVETVLAEPGPSSGAVVLATGAEAALRVRAEAADGSPVREAVVRWQVIDTAVARMDPATGRLTGLRPGTTRVLARVHGFAPLEWTIRVVTGTLVLQPARIGAAPGDTVRMEAMLLDETGTAFAAPREANWSVSDGATVSLTPEGQMVARRPGRVTVVVTTPWGGWVSGEVLVTGRLYAGTGATVGGIMQGDPEDLRELAPMPLGAGPDGQPARSPDGTRLAWISGRDGDVEIYASDADGQNARRLTTSPGFDGEVAWLPAGDGLVFVSARDGGRALWIDRLDGVSAAPLGAHGQGERREPSVAPDGSAVVALANDGGEVDLVVVDLAAGTERMLPGTAEQERAVAWLPGGELLVAQERSTGIALLLVDPATGASRVRLEAPGRFIALAASPDGARAALLLERAEGARLLLVPVAGGPPRELPVPDGMRLRDLDLR